MRRQRRCCERSCTRHARRCRPWRGIRPRPRNDGGNSNAATPTLPRFAGEGVYRAPSTAQRRSVGMGAMTLRIGIDIGGTFTDLVAIAADGRVLTHKTASTPDDYGEGIIEGLRALLAAEGVGVSE